MLATTSLQALQASEDTSTIQTTARTPYTINYDVFNDGDDVGTASRQLYRRDDGQWQIDFKSKISYYFISDKRTMSSVFAMNNNMIQPSYFKATTDTSLKSDTTLIQNFDWSTMQETGSFKGKSWNFELPVGALDSLSVITDLRQYFLDHSSTLEQEYGSVITKKISYRGGIRTQPFTLIGEEVLQLNGQKVRTLKVTLTEKKGTRLSHFWLAIDHAYLPLQIQRIKDGDEQAIMKAKKWNLQAI